MKHVVVPAVIPQDKQALVHFTQLMNFVNEIQIDVVDGQFVPTKSWPYEPTGDPKTIKQYTDPYTLEVDLMVAEPIKAAENWIAAGADMLVFHIESVTLEAFKNFSENCPVTVGVACNSDALLEDFYAYVAHADYVQLMGIREIGKQAEPFDERVLKNIKAVREQFPDVLISIDGSVNEATIQKLVAAGADRFVAGSAIVKNEHPEQAYKNLVQAVN